MDDNFEDVRIMTRSRDLDDYDILSIASISAAVPHKTNESFRHFIWAAMSTYAFGNKSIDHVMKRYDYVWQRYRKGIFEHNPRILLLRRLMEIIQQASSRLESNDIKDDLGLICAKSALIRLEASFKSAYGLIRKEYIFESDAVIRIIIEQIAWAYSAPNADPTKLSRLRPNKCITKLKEIFPDAGKLYGMLSSWAHIDPSIISDYERFHKTDTPVVRRSEHNSLQSGTYLVCLAIVYINVTQHIFKIYPTSEFDSLMAELQGMYESYQKESSGNDEIGHNKSSQQDASEAGASA